MVSFPTSTPAAPAAWYTDPADGSLLRWWDGAAWTENVTAPVSAEPATAPAETWGDWSRVEASPAPAATEYQPMAAYTAAATDVEYSHQPARGSVMTVWIWLLALVPLAVAAIVISRISGSGRAVYFGPIGVYVACALLDRRALVARGYDSAPNQWWILLAPVYFLLRAARTSAGSYAPFVLWVITTSAAGVLISISVTGGGLPFGSSTPEATTSTAAEPIAPPYSEAQLDYFLTPEGMAEQVKADLGLSFDEFSCIPLTSTEVSVSTTCTGTYVGTTVDVSVQVTERSADTEPFVILSVSPH